MQQAGQAAERSKALGPRARARQRVKGELASFLEAAGGFFRPYQREVFVDRSRLRVVLKPRQVGFSTLWAFEAALNAMFYGTDTLLVSASERNAQEVLEKAQKWVRIANKHGFSFRFRAESRSEVSIHGGGKILSLAQNPDTVRGFTGDVVLDEFAHHAEDRAIYASVFPVTTLGYRLTVGSTPLGQSGMFYDIWSQEDKYPDYRRYRVELDRAIAEGCPIDLEFIRRNMDDESFRQEYLCEFIDESTSYFPYSLLRGAVGEAATKGDAFLGVDIGRKHDNTVIFVFRQLEDRFLWSRYEVLPRGDFEYLREHIFAVIAEDKIIRGCVDSTGMGSQLAEELQKAFGFIEPVYFTNESKERMVTTLKRKMEGRSVVIPDDAEFIRDCHSIKKLVTAAGNVRFDAARTSEGHADRFWAMALALEAAASETMPRISWI